MINKHLTDPRSIVVVGGSNDVRKPGGKVVKNIIDNGYSGDLFVANPKEDTVQGVKSYRNMEDLPGADLAILAVAARHCLPATELLAKKKKTKAFIILSAGFSEESAEGAEMERKIVNVIDAAGACLIGPNCIGMMNSRHASVFTTPVPRLHESGVDFVSGSGAVAVYTMEAGYDVGLTFSSVWSVGNSAQTGVEEVVKYLDETFDRRSGARIKLLYMESVKKPDMLLRHASSLISKGCRIAAIKSGSSEAGSRAATSHTGALAGSDEAVSALFRKAGIVRCHSRQELINVAGGFMQRQPAGKRYAIITHAGGSAVMLTDTLSEGGLEVPPIEGEHSRELLSRLYPGSSVANPIDFLATGNAEQLGHIIDLCEEKFDNIDAMAVIFGSPGLAPVFDVYDLLHEKMDSCSKPIYPVLPSVINAAEEIRAFTARGRFCFRDEVTLGQALNRVASAPDPVPATVTLPALDNETIRDVVESSPAGYIEPGAINRLLDAAGIPRVAEAVTNDAGDAVYRAGLLGYPVVMKVVGPLHKSDAGGVVLNVEDEDRVRHEFGRLMSIDGAVAVMIQPMLSGTEIFAGVKQEPPFGHLVLGGLGGIFVEVFRDVVGGLAPLHQEEALDIIGRIRGKAVLEGTRGLKGVNTGMFADILVRLSALVQAAPEIAEMDLNPLLGTPDRVMAVDARIRINKTA